MMPRNCQLVRMKLLSKKSAKVLGTLAKQVIEKQIALQQHALESQSIREGMRFEKNEDMVDEGAVELKNDQQFEEEDFNEVDISGIFIKHDFDHVILDADADEIARYTSGDLACSTMRQSLQVPFEHDIQVLVYFLFAHFPNVETEAGQDEVDATMQELGMYNAEEAKVKSKRRSYDLKLVIGRNAPPGLEQSALTDYGVEVYYFYK